MFDELPPEWYAGSTVLARRSARLCVVGCVCRNSAGYRKKTAHAAGYAGHAASSSGFLSSTSKSSTVTTAVSSEHFARLLEPDDGIKESASELL